MLQKGRTKVEWARWRHILYGFNAGPYNSDLTPLAQCASFTTALSQHILSRLWLAYLLALSLQTVLMNGSRWKEECACWSWR